MAGILLISEEESLARSIGDVVSEFEGLDLTVRPLATDLPTLQEDARNSEFCLIHLTDNRLIVHITRILTALGKSQPSPSVMVVCDDHDPKVKLELLRHSASECLSRPLDLNRLRIHFQVLVSRLRFAELEQQATVQLDGACDSTSVPSGAMAQVIDRAQRAANLDVTILLTGETGVGKSHLAGLIHKRSRRKKEPFVVINCGAIPEALLESELFGHRKGAFTGADRDHLGKFAFVNRGTLLLDEVDCLPLGAQAKLLRVVDTGEFEPLSDSKTQRFHGRLLVATNGNLEQLVAQDRFRADLYYRLNVIELAIPPLRERTNEILALSRSFLLEFTQRTRQPVPRISPAAAAALCRYSWPGNIRELQNVMCRASVFQKNGTIEVNDLPASVLTGPANESSLVGTLESKSLLQTGRLQGELGKLLEALRQNNQNRTQTASYLGISRAALYKKLSKFGLIS